MTDKDDHGILDIRVSISGYLNVTLTLWMTTGKIMVQGNSIGKWVKDEYPIICQLYQDPQYYFSNPVVDSTDNISLPPSNADDDVVSVVNSVVDRVCLSVDHSDLPVPSISNIEFSRSPSKKPNKPNSKSAEVKISKDWMDNITNVMNKFDEKLADMMDFKFRLPALLK